MIRAAASVCGLIALGLSHVPASAGTCLTADIMSPGDSAFPRPTASTEPAAREPLRGIIRAWIS